MGKTDLMDRVRYVPRWFQLKEWLLTGLELIRHREKFREFGRTTEKVRGKNRLKKIRNAWLVATWSRKLRRDLPDRIHAHFASFPTDLAQQLAHVLELGYSFTAHAHDIYADGPDLTEKIAGADFVVTCTGFNHEILTSQKSNGTPIHCVYHGLDLRQWPFLPRKSLSEPLSIVSVGRLTSKKGHAYLLRAVHELVQQGIEVNCHLLGDGPLRAELEAEVAELGIGKEVVFHGHVPQEALSSWYQKAGVLVQASVIAGNGDRDGIPNVLLEAMASGLPVIATEVSGIPELVRDGETGILVPQRDSARIAGALLHLLEHPEIYQSISQRGRGWIEEAFGIDRATEQLLELHRRG